MSTKEYLISQLYSLALREVRRQGYVGIDNWDAEERKLRRHTIVELKAMLHDSRVQVGEIKP